jgi:hypothetical protein
MWRPLLASTALLALAACGDDEGGGSAQSTSGAQPGEPAAVKGAADRTAAAGTSRLALEGTIEIEGAEPIEFTSAGAVDFARNRSRASLDMSEFARTAPSEFASAGNWKGEVYYDADLVYVRLPVIQSAFPEAKEWVRIDAETLQQAGGAQFSAPDPEEFLQFAEAAADHAEAIGEEEIRGVATTGYRADIDVDELPAAAPPEERGELEAYARRLKSAGVESFPLEVWLDDEGLVRRLVAEYENMETGTSEADLSFAIELYDLGAELDVKAPPIDRVSDITDLIGRGAEANEEAEVFP